MKKIWLGALHYGSFVSFEEAKIYFRYLLNNEYLPSIDLSELYASGNAIKIVGKLCEEFSDIEVSIKYGLKSNILSDGKWAVEISQDGGEDLKHSLENYYISIPPENITSFQIHAFNKNKYKDWLNTIKSFQIFKNCGCSNMSPEELSIIKKYSNEIGLEISFAQIHGNILERRIINEYKRVQKIDLIIVNRSLARGFLSNRNLEGMHLKNSRTITSDRVKNSLPKEVKMFLPKLLSISKKYNLSLSQLAYIWLREQSNNNMNFLPIISPRNINDLTEYIELDNISNDKKDSLFKDIDLELKCCYENLNIFPLQYLEK